MATDLGRLAPLVAGALVLVSCNGKDAPRPARPATPIILRTTPASPAFDPRPQVEGTADPGLYVDLFASPDCTVPLRRLGVNADGSFFIGPAADMGAPATVVFTVRTEDFAGNRSECSLPISYQLLVSPPAPQVLGVIPAPGSTGLHPVTAIGIQFDMPITGFYAFDARGGTDWDTLLGPSGDTVTLVPFRPYAWGADVTMTASARNPAGGVLRSPYTWSFKVRDAPAWTLDALDLSGQGTIASADVALPADGRAAVLWSEVPAGAPAGTGGAIRFSSIQPGGGWSAPDTLMPAHASEPRVAVDAAGAAYAAFLVPADLSGNGPLWLAAARTRDAPGTGWAGSVRMDWGDPGIGARPPGESDPAAPSMAIGADVVEWKLAWRQMTGGVLHGWVQRPGSGDLPLQVDTAGILEGPWVFASVSGDAFLVWTEALLGTPRLWLRHWDLLAGWGEPEYVDDNPAMPSACLDEGGRLFLSWAVRLQARAAVKDRASSIQWTSVGIGPFPAAPASPARHFCKGGDAIHVWPGQTPTVFDGASWVRFGIGGNAPYAAPDFVAATGPTGPGELPLFAVATGGFVRVEAMPDPAGNLVAWWTRQVQTGWTSYARVHPGDPATVERPLAVTVTPAGVPTTLLRADGPTGTAFELLQLVP